MRTMQRWMAAILTMLLMVTLWSFAMGEESSASVLTCEELVEWAATYKARAMATQPLNDPRDERAFSEDGYAFVYDFGVLYMDRPEMTEEAVLRSVVITSEEEMGPRNISNDFLASEVLSAYYLENPMLEGDRSFAALYLMDNLPEGASWGWVQRDGQRLMTIQYAVNEQCASGGEGYTDAGVIYTIQDNLVAAIRVYGLDVRRSLPEVEALVAEVRQVANTSGYSQVPTSFVGSDLEPFQQEDLVFGGMDLLSLTPEEAEAALGAAREDTWMEDDNGEHLRTMEFGSCYITFVYSPDKTTVRLSSLTIDGEGLEGPRCLRWDDSLASALNRFRHGEGTYNEDGTEVLYGTPGGGDYGMAEYGSDASASLRYVLQTEDGREMTLYLYFEQMMLAEITVFESN